MALFNRGSKTPNGFNGRPSTGAQPEGGYGAAGAPGKAQKTNGKKGDCLRMTSAALKPSGGYGTHGRPSSKKPKVNQALGSYGADGMATPTTTIPSDQVKGRFNLPKGKFV